MPTSILTWSDANAIYASSCYNRQYKRMYYNSIIEEFQKLYDKTHTCSSSLQKSLNISLSDALM